MAFKDAVSASDQLSVSLITPTGEKTDSCPKCGKALKKHHEGKKICSNRLCRHIV